MMVCDIVYIIDFWLNKRTANLPLLIMVQTCVGEDPAQAGLLKYGGLFFISLVEISGSKSSQTIYIIIQEARGWFLCTGSHSYSESFKRGTNHLFRCKEYVRSR